MQKRKNAALIFIFITVLVDVIGIAIIIPVIPSLIKTLVGGDYSDAARIGGWLMFSFSSMQFFFAPILGGLSDKFGRRPVLLFSLLGLGLDYIFHAVAPTIGWLFVGRVLAGMAGASFTTANAYIADISTPEKRAQSFGLVGLAFGLGFIIGPVIGGVFSKFGIRVPFLIAAGLSLLNFLYGFFILPESLPAEKRRPFEWKRANPIGSLLHIRKYPVISGLLFSFVLVFIAGHAVQSTWTYFTMQKFRWDEQMVGYSLGFVGILIALVQGGLIRYTIPKIGQERSLFTGLFFNITGLILFSFASEGWMMFAILIPYAMGGLTGPSIQGIISNQVPSNEQGELQGAITGLLSLTSIIGPPLMTNLFYYFTREEATFKFSGAPFMAGALFSIISLMFAIRTLKKFPVKT